VSEFKSELKPEFALHAYAIFFEPKLVKLSVDAIFFEPKLVKLSVDAISRGTKLFALRIYASCSRSELFKFSGSNSESGAARS